jgi:hypothetical protein
MALVYCVRVMWIVFGEGEGGGDRADGTHRCVGEGGKGVSAIGKLRPFALELVYV